MWNISKYARWLICPALLCSLAAFGEVGEGLLWRVHSPKHPPSFLFATIHVDDRRVKALNPQVVRHFTEAKTLCLEILPDREAQVAIGQAMLLPKPHSLDDILGESLFNRLSLTLNKMGVDPVQATHLKPWAAMMVLSRPKSHGGFALDEQLYRWAEYQYKERCALETLQEQLAVFDSLQHKDQMALLTDTLDNWPLLHDMNEQLIEAYVAGDLEGIDRLSRNMQGSDHELSQRLRDALIDQRNIRMLNRMLPFLKKGRSFIAVGALHLPGEKGLLNLLREQGFVVTPAGSAPPP